MLEDFFDAIYFSFNIRTTVGLGDIVPATGSGRLVVVLEQVSAVTIIPLELATLSKALLQEGGVLASDEGGSPGSSRPRRQGLQCARCNLADHEEDAIFCRRCGAALYDSIGSRDVLIARTEEGR